LLTSAFLWTNVLTPLMFEIAQGAVRFSCGSFYWNCWLTAATSTASVGKVRTANSS